MRACVVAAGAFVGLAGCGSELTLDAPRAADVRASPIELLRAPWCEPLAERFCAAAAQCECDLAQGWPSDCEAAVVRDCLLDLALASEALPDGFLISTDTVPRCLELVEESLTRCELPPTDTFPVECQLVVPLGGVGFLRSGEICNGSVPCGRGLRCASNGRCRPPVGEGDQCQSTGDCEPGFTCFGTCERNVLDLVGTSCFSFHGQQCSNTTTCGISGQFTCQGTPNPEMCRSHLKVDCRNGEFCGFDNTCHARPGAGESCSFGFFCAPGLGCEFNSGRCVLLPLLGEACVGDENGNPVCARGLACRDGLCAQAPRLGEQCIFGLRECQAGLACNFGTDGTPRCALAGQADDPCQADTCAAGLSCDFNTFTCQRTPLEGERCIPNLQRCIEPFECVAVEPNDFRCARVTGLGDPCLDGCPQGLSCQLPAFEGTCVPAMCTSIAF